MGLFNAVFGKQKQQQTEVQNYFQAFTAYSPTFTTFEGGVYEMELTRAIIHSFATAVSKLKPEVIGAAAKNTLQIRPNPFMTTSQFLYRLATIFSVTNNAFIVPIENEYGQITGYFPLLPEACEVIDIQGVPFLRYTFANGKRAAIEYDRVGVLTQFQYRDDFFGSDNAALKPTMNLIHTQNQGIINGVKNSAAIRFLVRLMAQISDEDTERAREQFTADNLSAANKTGVLMYDNRFQEVKQVESKPFIVDAAQMEQIKENTFRYFGISENILQNKYTEDEWNAYYEGKIEPFAIQLSLALSAMTFTQRELAHGNMITLTAGRLQYASNKTKVQLSTQLFDRGILNRNDVMDMWHLPHAEGGEKYYIRREYAEIDKLHAEGEGKGYETVSKSGKTACSCEHRQEV